ncbi:hypothetical protein LVD15_05760 [Fulvivirga maritima]|uniref:hypothetical protein n=1 Tax=Fulvivirga maritima TaxID=2904247 RepID=UPI001F21A3F1|nr:hypothetical protein [Fulvivirga maritima]UII27926.1 hypothetical protein LVD15_05760 [Fulvivirga maritima]
MAETQKSNKSIVSIIGAVAGFSIMFFAVKYFMQPDLEKQLAQGVKEINEKALMLVDDFTRLDSAGSRGKSEFIYYYTFVGVEKEEVNVDTVTKYIRPNIINNAKSSSDMEFFRKK